MSICKCGYQPSAFHGLLLAVVIISVCYISNKMSNGLISFRLHHNNNSLIPFKNVYLDTHVGTKNLQRNEIINHTSQDVSRTSNTAQLSTKKKLYLEARGRLGNVMFEIAALYGISQRTNRTPIFSGNEYLPNGKDTFPFMRLEFKNKRTWPKSHMGKYSELRGRYTPSLWSNLSHNDVQICCYLQSFKYFHDYRDEIRKMFTFSPKILSNAHGILRKIKTNLNVSETVKVTYVSIHVRRGDILGKKHYDIGYRVPQITYIRKAMLYYLHKYSDSVTVFVVCSDDIKWCKENLKNTDTYFIHENAKIDMATMISCNHTIATTGSYSWWTGYLKEGEVIYYKDQFAEGTKMGDLVSEDRYPPDWIPMSD